MDQLAVAVPRHFVPVSTAGIAMEPSVDVVVDDPIFTRHLRAP
jgi:hypothetical protein